MKSEYRRREKKYKEQDTHLVFPKLQVQARVVIPRDDQFQRGIDLAHELQGGLEFFWRRPECQVAAMEGDVGFGKGSPEAIPLGLGAVFGWVEEGMAVSVRDDEKAGADI